MLGIAYCYVNKPKEAAHTFLRCLHIFQKLFGEDNIYNGVAFTGLSVSLHLMGCIDESQKYSEKAIKIFETYPDVSYYRGMYITINVHYWFYAKNYGVFDFIARL